VTNAELVRSIYESWARDEQPSELFHPDIEWSLPHPGGKLKGREDLLAFLRSFMGAWDEHAMEVEELRELDDGRVLALFTERARGRMSGVETVANPAALWTVRDGRVVRCEGFGDRDEALRVAGLG
jgi:ketosteroid isomerase-like protein